jgi:salicylate hydroxylase
MSLLQKKFVVAGGGIAGLAMALGLLQKGADVTVLEQAEAITEVGAGLQISPNGLKVLQSLGVADELAALSQKAKAVVLRDYRRGPAVARLDLQKYASGSSYLLVHRADLIDVLARAVRAAGAKVRLLQQVARYEDGPSQKLVMTCGTVIHADVVIGADGVKSVIRQALNGTEAPFFTGQVAWRAIVPNVIGQGPEARVYMGPQRHLVCYPLRDGNSLNIVAVKERAAWANEGWNFEDDPAHLRATFHQFHPEVRQMLDQVQQVHLWGLFRHRIAPNWHNGQAVLLGDAAHPTLPFLAQGANMALEDSHILLRCLESCATEAEAFDAYQSIRFPRVNRIIEAANGNAWKYHLASKPLRLGAHIGMGLFSRLMPAQMVGSFDWLYEYDVTRQPIKV